MATKNIAPSMQIQASRGPKEKSVLFGDLKPWKNTWLVHVKVLHAWKQYIQSVETMEFVLADETVSAPYCIYQSIMSYLTFWDWLLIFQIHMAFVLGAKNSCNM